MIYIKSKGSFRKISCKALVEKLKEAKAAVAEANGHTDGRLVTGGASDSSDDAEFRAEYVLLAQKQILEEQTANILARAEILIQRDINRLSNAVDEEAE
jgi:hypothetical protein